MLSLQEALLFKAAQEEQEKQEAIGLAGGLGATGGAALGLAGGTLPHQVGRGVNAIRGRKPNPLRPGYRMAGALTGMILGGGLGAGTAAVMKQDNQAAQLLGKIQASGELSKADEAQLAQLLGEFYSAPSRIG